MPDWLQYNENPIRLHSGEWSHWFVDGKLIFVNDHEREAVLDCWERAITNRGWNQHELWFFGIPTGGTFWAEAIARRMKGLWLNEYRTHDDVTQESLLDDFTSKPHTVLVDDVATTGNSFVAYPIPSPRLVVVKRKAHNVLVTASWASIYLPTCEAPVGRE